ncbi:MAG: hypothetical protein WCS75_04325 [Sphingomonas sp.]|jgi:hypothetical protein|uniref:hypothetical protein n=1 Tax=Sphingomonas sp. TaxID=28214 RepID=UPI0035679C4C
MASLAEPHPIVAKDDRFFFVTSLIMAAIVVAGFSLMIVTGRSSFASPPIVHAHAVVFMGWVVLYVTQNALVARGSITLHRRLGWIGAGWIVAMVVLGTVVTVRLVRLGHAPFFFPPALFLVLNPVSILTFAGLTAAAIVRRRQTEWHRRLHFSGMALLLGPAYGRLLPMPFLIPYAYEVDFLAVLIFPVIGIIADLRRSGKVHPAWWWGLGTIVGSTLLVEAIAYSPVGTALYHAATAGSPGASVAPLAYPPFPPLS